VDSKLLIFELNEVPYKVIDQFISDHPKSTFAAVLPKSARRHSHLPDTGQMHPKTSWHTFHRGVPDHVHGYREYNQIEAPGQHANPTFLELARRVQGLVEMFVPVALPKKQRWTFSFVCLRLVFGRKPVGMCCVT